MDEIDAALDFKNVSIVGHYIKVCDGKEARRRSICFMNFLCFWKRSRFLILILLFMIILCILKDQIGYDVKVQIVL
jgi:hypothetical protein